VGIDIDPAATALAAAAGATTFAPNDAGLDAHVRNATNGLGLDAVLICASTRSNGPLELATRLTRDRGSVVVVGNVPIAADWKTWYEKELELRLSRSYGPGRYDREYEEGGRDLPAGYVRWTEERNLQAFLDLVAAGRIKPDELTTHRFAVDQAEEAYAVLSAESDGPRGFGVLLEYPEATAPVAAPAPKTTASRRTSAGGAPRIGLIGAGAFARSVLLPALQLHGAQLGSVASERGLTAADVAARFGFERAADSIDHVLEDDEIDAVVIATRHSSHSDLAAAALRAGKAVFVEKPLALSWEGLLEVEDALTADSILMVGFNRRFAPMTATLKRELDGAPERAFVARVNAGPLPHDHWMHDPELGGGRLLGEGCHFVDLLGHLAGSPPLSVQAFAAPQPERPLECSDTFAATIRYADGTVGSLIYTGGGDPRLSKERIEGFGGGAAVVIDDFRRFELYRGGKQHIDKMKQDKGHKAEVKDFLAAVAGEAPRPSAASYLASSRATLAIIDAIRTGLPVDL
jgi:predicted dehydrogenase